MFFFFNLWRHGRVPSKHAIKTWIKNFEETGSALKKKPKGRPRSARTPQNIEAVRVSVSRSPRRSVRKLAAAVKLSRECVRRILHIDLKFHPVQAADRARTEGERSPVAIRILSTNYDKHKQGQ